MGENNTSGSEDGHENESARRLTGNWPLSARSGAVVVVLLIAGLLALYLWSRVGPASSGEALKEEDSSPRAEKDRTGRQSQLQPNPFPHQTGTKKAQNSTRRAEDRGPNANTVRVMVVSSGGEAIPSVQFRCVVQSPAQTIRTPEWYAVTYSVTTDEAGSFELSSDPSHVFALEPKAEGWQGTVTKGEFASESTLTVVLRPTMVVRLRIQYDDGQPFQGRASIVGLGRFASAENEPNRDKYSRWFDCDEFGAVLLEDTPVDRPLACRVSSNQMKAGYAGFDDHMQRLEVHELQSGQDLLVIIRPAQDLLGLIQVNVPTQVAQSLSIVVEWKGYPPTTNERLQVKDGSWRSDPLIAGTYRITILGPLAWRSEWVEVRKGETTHLTASLQRSGSVRARVVDQAINPIMRGTLRVQDGGYFLYGRATPRADMVGIDGWSDADGVVVLSGLPPGPVTVEGEAWLKEPAIREAEVVSGSTVDIGDVVLHDAVGEITVEITGRKDGIDYFIDVSQPSNGSVRPDVPLTGNTGTVKGLALRRYHVYVRRSGDGRLIGEYVTLTADHPSQTVRIDVGKSD
jgi:hypothetical protein